MPETPTVEAFAQAHRRALDDMADRCHVLVVASLVLSAMIMLTGACALWAIESHHHPIVALVCKLSGSAFVVGNIVALVRLALVRRRFEHLEAQGWTTRDALHATKRRP